MKYLNKKGVSLTEYVLIIGLIVLGVIVGLTLFGDALYDFYLNIVNGI